MHLLYLDESGSTDAMHFVVAGLIVHWRNVEPLKTSVERIVADRLPEATDIEIHAGQMRTGRRRWSRFPRSVRNLITDDVVSLLLEQSHIVEHPLTLVAVVTDRSPGQGLELYEQAYSALFEICDQRIQPGREPAGILAIADNTRLEPVIQGLVTPGPGQMSDDHASRGAFTHLLEPPLFIDSRLSRLVQLADFAAHWLYRAYEHDDHSILNQILSAFSSNGGAVNSLVHLSGDYRTCTCAACRSRR